MTDYHCHILPGIDDGSDSLEESLAMAAAFAQAGFQEVFCTPHRIHGSYDATSGQVRAAVASLQSELDRNKIPLRLYPGREHYLDEYLLDTIASDPLPLGDTNLLLVELPSHCDPERVKQVCFRLTSSGYRVLLAHPERSRLFAPPPSRNSGLMGTLQNLFSPRDCQQPPDSESLLAYTRTLGCAFQGNLGSFTGYYGERVRANAAGLARAGVYTHYGSDAHTVAQLQSILVYPLPEQMG